MTDKADEDRPLVRSARERELDRREGRPQRGLFTGRGRPKSKRPLSDRHETGASKWDDDDDDRPRPRRGTKRSLMRSIRLLPRYIRLLFGLIADRRVSVWDRFFVLAAIGYILSPLDFIPDVIPFLGQMDDLFLLMLALQRLVNNAGQRVLLSHWKGDPADLSNLNIARIISAAGFFLPGTLKRRLRRLTR